MFEKRNYKIEDSDYKYTGDVKRIDSLLMMNNVASSYKDPEEINA